LLLLDRAAEAGETRRLAFEWGYSLVVSRKKNRVHSGEYNQEWYKQGNEVERMFRYLIGYRRIGISYDTLNLMFSRFISPSFVHCSLLVYTVDLTPSGRYKDKREL
jgi:transposase